MQSPLKPLEFHGGEKMNNDIQRLSSAARSEVINALTNTLHAHYIFPEAAEEVAFMLHLRQSRGEYDALDEGKPFAETLTTHIREVSNDSHLSVFYEPQPANLDKDTEFSASGRDMGTIFNYGFEKVERLAGNIGLLCMSTFFSPTVAFRAAITAMDFIAHTNALILDLRAASGGDLMMLKFFASYFFGSDPVHLNDIYWRSHNSMQEYWTLPYIPGHRYAEKPVSILTSRSTAAVAEGLAYALQNEKRATIVGEVTAGEANPLERFALCAQFASWIPVGRIASPVTGTNWEGSGVRPDIEVTREDALKSAYTLALRHVLESNGHMQNPVQDALEREIREVLARQS
jgi:Peptidase family S41/N-terminal domain of Peptidase_S41 in eukaryotic IRBP